MLFQPTEAFPDSRIVIEEFSLYKYRKFFVFSLIKNSILSCETIVVKHDIIIGYIIGIYKNK